MADWGAVRSARDAVALTFRGSRAELDRVIALRLQAVIVLIFLTTRCVHLGQAGVDLALARSAYTHEGVALALGAACGAESVLFAAVTLRARRLLRGALLGEALFGMVGLGLMAFATSSTPGRAGSLNWLLPYTVATAAGLGVVARGDLEVRPPGGRTSGLAGLWRRRAARTVKAMRGNTMGWLPGTWAAAVMVALAGVYVLSVNLPYRLPDERATQIWGNAANYPLFFAAATLGVRFLRHRLAVIAARNTEVTSAAAALAHEAQWRAVAVDVFGPVIALLERVADLSDGEVPVPVRSEADRLISMIEAVRPPDGDPFPRPPSSGDAQMDIP